MLFRLLFSCCFWVVFARWGYEEIKLFSPEIVPVVDTVLERVTPNTHDKWPEIVYVEGEAGFPVRFVSPPSEKEQVSSSKAREALEKLSLTDLHEIAKQLNLASDR
ncbi:hypothetical protein MRY87_08305 [bacterium]|nr:hypothetical protein [bacterium]